MPGGERLVQPVELRLRSRVDGRDQHGERPEHGETRVLGGQALPVALAEHSVDPRPAPEPRLPRGTERRGRRAERVALAHAGLRPAWQLLVRPGSARHRVTGDVRVGRRLRDPDAAPGAHPRGADPVQLPATARRGRGRQADGHRHLGHQVAHHRDRRRHLHAGDPLDLVVLRHRDAAVDAGQEVRLHGPGLRFQLRPCQRGSRGWRGGFVARRPPRSPYGRRSASGPAVPFGRGSRGCTGPRPS